MTKYWYRYEDRHTAPPLDEYDQPIGRGDVHIDLLKLVVLRHTPKGVWIRYFTVFKDERFVLTDARKRFACPTVREARVSFLARKKKQLSIHSARAQDVRDAVVKAESVFKREDALGR